MERGWAQIIRTPFPTIVTHSTILNIDAITLQVRDGEQIEDDSPVLQPKRIQAEMCVPNIILHPFIVALQLTAHPSPFHKSRMPQ